MDSSRPDEQIITLSNIGIEKDLNPGDEVVLGKHTYSINSIKYCLYGKTEVVLHWKSSKVV